MKWVKTFSEIGKDDAAIAGGKGASLGEMTQAGIPVPPGFVVLAPAFEHFVKATGLATEIDSILSTVKTEVSETVERASENIQALILADERGMPQEVRDEVIAAHKTLAAEFVAVRSSATAEDGAAAAWAGQLDTYLNTTPDTLLANVKRCWASLFTARAIFYRFEKQLDATAISVAVVVQKMVNADAAGVAFSVDPVTQDRNLMIIEGSWGLGESVVSGSVTPDSYTVSREPRAIVDTMIAEKEKGIFKKVGGGSEWLDIPAEKRNTAVLTEGEVIALSDAVVRIEKHYGFPVDVEWAVEKGALFILQSRPITTLSS